MNNANIIENQNSNVVSILKVDKEEETILNIVCKMKAVKAYDENREDTKFKPLR